MIFLLLGVALACLADEPTKVAIIVASGIENGQRGVNQAFQENRELTEKTFARAGYRVITLGWGQKIEPTAENLKREMAALGKTDQLHLAFVGHGDLTNAWPKAYGVAGGLDPKRFPPVDMNQEDLNLVNVNPAAPVQFYMRDDNDNPESYIGVGDVRAGLDSVRKKNPDLKTSVIAMNCYGGHLTRDLNGTPGLIAFAGAERSKSARVLKNSGPSADFAGFMTQELAKGRSFQSAFEEGQRRFIEGSLVTDASNPSESGLPRSQSQELLDEWCRRIPERSEADHECAQCNPSTEAQKISRRIAMTNVRRETTGLRDQIKDIYDRSICAADRPAARAYLDQAVERLNRASWGKFTEVSELPPGAPLAEMARDRQRVADRCAGGQESIPGEHYAMTFAETRALFERVFRCIDESEGHPIARGWVGEKLRLWLTALRDENACHWMRYHQTDFQSRLECADNFQAKAGDKEWARLVEISELSTRSLFKDASR